MEDPSRPAVWTASAASTTTCSCRSLPASAAPAPPPAPSWLRAGGAASGGTSPSSPSAKSRRPLSTPPSTMSPARSCPSSTSVSPSSTGTHLCDLLLWMEKNVYGLRLDMEIPPEYRYVDRSLMELLVQLPEFSVLELSLASYGHVFGAMVLNLLGVFTTIRRLTVDIRQREVILYLVENVWIHYWMLE
uniref:Uncharacterized protein n=1 Tax=Arundo donax TaxID=35708 RepID=A0A0A9AX75_ARUDO